MKQKRTPDTRDSIVFAGPVRDAHGNTVTELFNDQASWELKAIPLMVPTGEVEQSPLALPGGAQRPKLAPIFVPFYEVVQHLPDGRAVALLFPVEQVRAVRHPCVAVEVKDATGAVVERKLVSHAAAAKHREAEAQRERLRAVSEAPAEPSPEVVPREEVAHG